MQHIADMVDELLVQKTQSLSKALGFTSFDWDVLAEPDRGVTVRLESETHFNMKPSIIADLEDVLKQEEARKLFEQQIFRMVGNDGFYDIAFSGLTITNEETIRGQKGIDQFFNVAKRNDSVQNQVMDFVLKLIERYKR